MNVAGLTGQLKQQQRFLSIETPLGPDKVVLRSFSGLEAMSQLYHFDLDLVSQDANLDFGKIIGQNVTIHVQLADPKKERYFHGIISRFAQLPREGRLAHYRAEMVPRLWMLTRATDCALYQNLSVLEIVEQVLKKNGVTDFETSVSGRYDKWEYCVQYRETACNFVMRLLEQEGLFFFFRHEKQKHVMVIADSPSAHKPSPEQPKVRYEAWTGSGYKRAEDGITGWRFEQEFRPGKYTIRDFNFEMPGTDLLATCDTQIQQGGNTAFEIYDYPGEYENKNQGETQAKLRMEEEELEHTIISGESDCRVFSPGNKFELIGHDRRDQNGAYVLTSVTHHAQQGGLYSGVGSPEEARYQNTFACIPFAIPFRPLRRTPKPMIQGSQTAFVVGPKGEEIFCDKYGRVKVQFHWDRIGKDDDQSSCWVRVSQPWAGKNWGAISIPRIGQEVIVDFLEGDPDRPIITGRVYNAGAMPPYALPDEQTKTTFKTNSSKGGGGFNELRFEDKKGSEQIFLHGEKDLDIRVKNDRFENIDRDRHLTVERDRFEEIKRDIQSKSGRDLVQEVGRDHHLTVGGKQAIDVGGSVSIKAGSGLIAQVTGNTTLSSTGALYMKGMNVVIEASAGLTIKAGGSFVTVNAGGVQISGPMVMINSGGSALSGSAGSPVSPLKVAAVIAACKAEPGEIDKIAREGISSLKSHDPKSDESKNKTAWIEVELVDENGKPVPGEVYEVTLPDGSVSSGTLNEKGVGRIEHIDPGNCQVTFPNLDKNAWE
jgi:type VI secretion system secreted protein VgrG